jgi:radical SAM/Cys-rich protein
MTSDSQRTSDSRSASDLQGELARTPSPRRVTSLIARGAPLASPAEQRRVLARLEGAQGFDAHAARAGFPDGLTPAGLRVFQINLGKLCNMTCAHCHVDAGPDRAAESMPPETVSACLRALDRSGATTVDLTGGAPELHPSFRDLVEECARRGVHVIDRCNLTVLLLPRMKGLPEWLGERGVEVACSLPHHRRPATDAQRGDGTYEKSIEALRLLNAAGYGQGDPSRKLTLVCNPAGAFLAPAQAAIEPEWRASLLRHHGVTFDAFIALNNMPISRFLEWLIASGNLEAYSARLLAAFNPATVAGLMCRDTISVSWDGRLFDCDFNQMLDIPVQGAIRVDDYDPVALAERRIRTAAHCFGCTAGAGSSCAGATAR